MEKHITPKTLPNIKKMHAKVLARKGNDPTTLLHLNEFAEICGISLHVAKYWAKKELFPVHRPFYSVMVTAADVNRIVDYYSKLYEPLLRARGQLDYFRKPEPS